MAIYFVFYIMVLFLGLLSNYTRKLDSKFFEVLLLVMVVGFAAVRLDVGTDTPAYESVFQDIDRYGYTDMHIESGYFYLNWAVSSVSGGFNGVLFLAAAISSIFLFKAVNFHLEGNNYKWLAYITFISIGVYFVYYFSGVRQGIAISIFLYAIRFITSRQLLKYALLIGVGALFHTSLIITLPLYFIPRKPLNRILVISLVAAGVVGANIGLTDKVFQLVIGGLTGHYGGYAELFNSFANTKSGIGVIIRILLGLVVIAISPYWVKDEKTTVVYNIFSVGLVLYGFFLGVDILIRISEYFVDVLIFALPYSVAAFEKKTKPVYILFSMLILGALYYSNLNFDGMKLVPFKIFI